MRTVLLAAVLLAGSVVACGSSSEDTKTTSARLVKGCVKTLCESWNDDTSDNCSQCIKMCSGDDCTTCSSMCSGVPCPPSIANECMTEGFKLSAELKPDPAAQAACEAMFAHLDACELVLEDSTVSDCATWAKFDGPGAIGVYGCVAKLSCDTTSLRSCAPPASTFGDELIAAHQAKCPGVTYSDDDRRRLNDQGAQDSETHRTIAKNCVADNACADIPSCLDAWRALE